MESKIKVLMDDFTELAGKMGDTYKPADVALLANIGSTLMTMLKIAEKHEMEVATSSDDVANELMDAETYYERWQKTGDITFKTLAKDELRHADVFMKHARMVATDDASKAKLQTYVDWFNMLSKRLG